MPVSEQQVLLWGHAPKQAYEVIAVDRKGCQVGRSIYVDAVNAERAEYCGRILMRMFGRKRSYAVQVRVYKPWLDPEMGSFVRCNDTGAAA